MERDRLLVSVCADLFHSRAALAIMTIGPGASSLYISLLDVVFPVTAERERLANALSFSEPAWKKSIVKKGTYYATNRTSSD